MSRKPPKMKGPIGHWNHRVVRHVCPTTKEEYFTIEECYYNKGQKTPWSFTEDLNVHGESIKGLRWTLNHMLKCLKDPIVDATKYRNRK